MNIQSAINSSHNVNAVLFIYLAVYLVESACSFTKHLFCIGISVQYQNPSTFACWHVTNDENHDRYMYLTTICNTSHIKCGIIVWVNSSVNIDYLSLVYYLLHSILTKTYLLKTKQIYISVSVKSIENLIHLPLAL